jgi:hypothetical protein
MLGSAQVQARKKAAIRSPLTSIGLVTDVDADADPDDPGMGGGVDSTVFFTNKLVPKISACTAIVQSVAATWAKANQLGIVKLSQKPGNLLMHVSNAGLAGFFEVVYRVDVAKERARATLFFYSPDGARHEPVQLRAILDQFEIMKFQDQLVRAMTCEAK